MNIIEQLILAQAAADVPVGALVAIGIFVALFALFVFAWVRKRKRGLDEEAPRPEAEPKPEPPKEEKPPPKKPGKKKPVAVEPPPAELPVHDEIAPPAEEVAKPPKKKPAVAEAPAEPPAEEAPVEPPKPVFPSLGDARTMQEGLQKTKGEGFVARIGKLFRGKQVDDALLDELEEVMFTSDIGVQTSQSLLESLRADLSRKELKDQDAVWARLREETRKMLDRANEEYPPRPTEGEGPRVMMVIGVNGTGKTTSIGKLAARYASEGEKIMLAACDTFRAAAVEQLAIWAKRVGVDIHSGEEEADPASVAFDAIRRATKEGHSLVIVDTAGRLHTQINLMDELSKVHRVIGKARPGAPHEVLLVLDSTTGQNAIRQAELFRNAVAVDGIVLTKLDGTAKGGVVIGISDQLNMPIRWVGVGERVEDLRRFESAEFVEALYGE